MQNILVPVDFSACTPSVIATARSLSQAFEARLWLVHVAPPDPDFVGYEAGPQTVRDQVAEHLRDEHRQLQNEAEHMRKSGLDVVALMLQGATVKTILDEAQHLGVDHIVMGSHGRGALLRGLLGSVSEGVLRGARCPVTILPAAFTASVSASAEGSVPSPESPL